MPPMMRGLQKFITDIRNCKSKKEEAQKVESEMAKIRGKFGKTHLTGYHNKKYVWKLMYMFMLGYDPEFGHMEAIRLISSTKFSEKSAGYLAISVLLNEHNELLRLVIQSIKKDLQPNNEFVQSAALSCVANVGGQEFAESLADDVQKILLSPKSRTFVRKKAALCMLRLFRKYPDAVPQDGWQPKILGLLDDAHLGVVTSVMSLVLGLVSVDTTGFEDAPAKATHLLTRLVFFTDKKSVYKYYMTLCPWLQIKLLRMLQYFPPPSNKSVLTKLNHVLSEILTKTKGSKSSQKGRVTKKVNKKNADHGILFEAINVIIHMCGHGVKDLHKQALRALVDFIETKEPNYRYIGLETMARLAKIPGTSIKQHQKTIQHNLKDPDVSIRKRAMDLLFAMCDKSNAKDITNTLLKYLQGAQIELREELVLKIAILAEKFATDLRWYLDVVLQLISLAGDSVTDDIWFRVVQIVTNNEDLQDYAASTCFKFLKAPFVHENGIKVGSYILGEFGHRISDQAVTGAVLLDLLRTKWPVASKKSKALILSAYIKMANTYPELKEAVGEIFALHRTYVDTEIQQRACEYYVMNQNEDDALMTMVFNVMPNFPERESLLLKRLKKKADTAADRDVWVDPNKKVDAKKKKKQTADDSDDSNSGSSGSDSDSSGSSSGSGSGSDSDDDSGFGAQDMGMLRALYGKDTGKLYSSAALEVGAQMEVEGGILKLTLFYGNKTKTSITELMALVPALDAIPVQVRPNKDIEIKPRTQVKQYFMFNCAKPFGAAPNIKLQFKHGGKAQTLTLAMPILATSFITPQAVASTQFVPQWQKLGNEVRVVFKLNALTTAAAIKAVLSSQLGLAIVEGVEANEHNLCAAGVFHSTPRDVNMPIMLRVQTKPDKAALRVSAHAAHVSLSQAVADAVALALGARAS